MREVTLTKRCQARLSGELSYPAVSVSPVLEELRITGLGVIQDATLPLGPGLTVITGETGAGKTMVVTGLGLLLGNRADSGAVRSGAAQAAVDGVWSVPEHGAVVDRVREAGGDVEPLGAHSARGSALLHGLAWLSYEHQEK